MFYAGIGSRETPKHILDDMASIAAFCACKNYTLRSGGAGGADIAFEDGCDSVSGNKQIFLPWRGFQGRTDSYAWPSDAALAMAAQFHPNWSACSRGARALHARNCFQILGADLDSPVSYVVCWTPGASGSGGTGQAIRIAKHNSIPVFDLGNQSEHARIMAIVAAG